MQDRNWVITGGTDGMGKATAHRLAAKGGRLLLVGRNRAKGEAATAELIQKSGNEAISFLQADLSLVGEMRQAAEHIRRTFDRLDGLVHGAGGAFPKQRTLTREGLELVFAVQYLVRQVLTNELLGILQAAPTPKIVHIDGGGASRKIDFENLQGEKSYSLFGSIGRAAATNDLLTLEQMARYPEITFYNYGPGIVRTAATTRGSTLLALLVHTAGRLFTRAPEQAASDIVRLLTETYPGGFYGPSLQRKDTYMTMPDAAKLWSCSEQLLGKIKT